MIRCALKWIVAAVFLVLAVGLVGLGLKVRDSNEWATQGAASATLDLLAKNAYDFFLVSNRLPKTQDEITGFVLGAQDGMPKVTYHVSSAARTQFCLTYPLAAKTSLESTYQIAGTNMKRLTSVKRVTH